MHIAVSWQLLPEFAIVGLAATALTAALIVALMPLMVRYAMAKPNARSSHATPTPQGGGMAVVTAVVLLGVATMLYLPNFDKTAVTKVKENLLRCSLWSAQSTTSAPSRQFRG